MSGASVRLARRLRVVLRALEIALSLVVVGSVAAFGSVHPWARVPLWVASAVTGLLVAAYVGTVRSLRRRIGCRRFVLRASDLVADDEAASSFGWSFDLGRPAMPAPPLLLPGLLFLGWVLLQLVPLPAGVAGALGRLRPASGWSPLTVSVEDTTRGMAFLACALTLHVAGAVVLAGRSARERFRWTLAGLGTGMALLALLQAAAGATAIYGVFEPLERGGRGFFGPFVNRNHFAGYMLMVVPTCLALVDRSLRGRAERAGERAGLRRMLVALGPSGGTAPLYATVAVLATTSALLATTSRGALLAFAVALGLAGLGLGRREVPAGLLTLGAVAMALSWGGLERLETRLGRALDDLPGRTLVWRDSIRRMDGRWLTGTGFDTFAAAMSRTDRWALPRGASPWPAPLEEAIGAGAHLAVRVPAESADWTWYREAHNDYLQVLVETGIPGLAIALWAAARLLRATRRSPWLLAALAGVLLHSFVDFDLQIPAVAVLFAVLAALPAGARAETREPRAAARP